MFAFRLHLRTFQTSILGCASVELEISRPHFVIIAILSHGNKNDSTGLEEIMDVHMNGIPIRDIKKMFIDGKACPCMVGKPKLFLIQACRGSITQPQGHLR